jgi:hypothetical protein
MPVRSIQMSTSLMPIVGTGTSVSASPGFDSLLTSAFMVCMAWDFLLPENGLKVWVATLPEKKRPDIGQLFLSLPPRRAHAVAC